ncbi:hypothetical protein ACHAWF_015617 [Thalassiosira exigua]
MEAWTMASTTTHLPSLASSSLASSYASSPPPIPMHIVIKHGDDDREGHEGETPVVDNLSGDGDGSEGGGRGRPSARRDGPRGGGRRGPRAPLSPSRRSALSPGRKSERTTPPPPLPLVDEIDLRQALVHPSKPRRASAIQGAVIGKERLEVMCNHGSGDTKQGTIAGSETTRAGAGGGFRACPCCRRYIEGARRDERRERRLAAEPLSSDECGPVEDPIPEEEGAAAGASATDPAAAASGPSLVSSLWASLTMQDCAAPPLVRGDAVKGYKVTETIVQGWLYKKGTGDDYTGRRWWKPRWVTLALAETPNGTVPAPCLISHRAPGVPYPASVIELTQSTVIMAIERTTARDVLKDAKAPAAHGEWNRHCFQVVHAGGGLGEGAKKTTRIFTAPAEDRNEWVFVVNNALLDYEKRLSKARNRDARRGWGVGWGARTSRSPSPRSSPKERQTGFDGLRLCGEMSSREQRGQHEEGIPICGVAQSTKTGEDDGGEVRRRMRSPSPVRARRAGGLPPVSPRGGGSRPFSPPRVQSDPTHLRGASAQHLSHETGRLLITP